MAATSKSTVPTAKSLAPSGISCSRDEGVGRTVIRTGALMASWAVEAAVAYRTCDVVATDSSESANPTGTTNAATMAASNMTRYRFRIARFLRRARFRFFCANAIVAQRRRRHNARPVRSQSSSVVPRRPRGEIAGHSPESCARRDGKGTREERVFTSCGARSTAALWYARSVVEAS